MAQEAERGCGYRKVGGLYLCGEYISVPCDRLPYPLDTCPVCGGGIKVSRGFTQINPLKLFNLIVHSSYRGQGVGKMLMDYLKPRFVRCKTDMSTGNPITYYEKLGYIHVGNYDLWGNKALIGRNRNIAWMQRGC